MQEKKGRKNSLAVRDLIDWLCQNKISLYALAKMAKTHYTTIWKLANGDHPPSLETALKIEEITDGSVPCRSWITAIQTQTLEKSQKKSKAISSTKNKKKGHECSR